jgi:hypothetical protein
MAPRGKRRGRQTHHGGLGLADELRRRVVERVTLVDHHYVEVVGHAANRERLGAGDLERPPQRHARVVRLNDAVRRHAVGVGYRGGLVDERLAVADEDDALPALKRLIAQPKREIRLPCSGGGHHDLASVSRLHARA